MTYHSDYHVSVKLHFYFRTVGPFGFAGKFFLAVFPAIVIVHVALMDFGFCVTAAWKNSSLLFQYSFSLGLSLGVELNFFLRLCRYF